MDNWTNQPVKIPGAGLYCPPWVIAWTAPIEATMIAAASFEAPIGTILPPTPLVPGTANVLFTEDEQPLSAGTGVGPPQSGQDVIGQMTAVTVDVMQTKRFTVPLGTHGIGLNIQQLNDWNGGPVSTINVIIKGVQSGTFYVNQSMDPEAGLSIVPISSPLDTQIDVSLIPGPVRNPAQVATILAIKDIEAMQVYNGFPFTKPLTVNQGQGSAPGVTWLISQPWAVGKAPYDGFVSVAPGIGVSASSTMGAVVGRRWVADHGHASCVAGAAAALVQTAVLNDGVATIWNAAMGISAVLGNAYNSGFTDGAFIGSVNTSMTMSLPAATNVHVRTAIGGFYF